jgi:hypothetical protein
MQLRYQNMKNQVTKTNNHRFNCVINVHSIMRGRIAAAAVGSHVAKKKAQAAGAQKEAANQKEIDDLKSRATKTAR